MVDELGAIFRDEWGRVLATLIGFLGDFDRCCVDAYPGGPEVSETWETFESNALLKPVATAQATGRISIADETALAVDPLNGEVVYPLASLGVAVFAWQSAPVNR